MGYLGNPVTKNFTTTTPVQTLTGDGSVSYALSAAAAVPEDIAVLRNGVRQKPTTDYSPYHLLAEVLMSRLVDHQKT
jgi:hypothetical protein